MVCASNSVSAEFLDYANCAATGVDDNLKCAEAAISKYEVNCYKGEKARTNGEN